MPCYRPLTAWRARRTGANGKRPVVFSPKAGFIDLEVQLPCGRCIGCRLEYSRQWAMRCMHEASLHEKNSFITLTFKDEYLPDDWSLDKRHWQLFAKRLRHVSPFRFFMSGEYGEKLSRPHYHALLFGLDFEDKEFLKNSPAGEPLFVSNDLSRLWPYGFSSIGAVTFESAAYVARYVVKKITGDLADEHYQGRLPEFALMSRRPGIGSGWIDAYQDDVYPSDEVIVRGHPSRPPRYYDNRADARISSVLVDVRSRRVRKGKRYAKTGETTYQRLAVKETVSHARLGLNKRKL